MTLNKYALFENAKARWPTTIDFRKDPDALHDIYWTLDQIVSSDDNWQQIALWSFHQTLDELQEEASNRGETTISPQAVAFADFDRWMRCNLAGDKCWMAEKCAWENNGNPN